MKAIVWTRYGPPDGLQLKEIEKPTPKDDELLIKVYATTVTAGDVKARSVTFLPAPWFTGRLMTRMKPILGMELVGIIEAVGKNVTLFRNGDRVFGTTSGLTTGGNILC